MSRASSDQTSRHAASRASLLGRLLGSPSWQWVAAAFSGLLTGLAFPPFGQDWLVWIALMPLIFAVWFAPKWQRIDWLRLFLLGWVAGSVGFLLSLFWITEVTGIGWVALSLYCGVYPGIFACFLGTVAKPRENPKAKRSVWLSSRANLSYAVLGAAAWVTTELLRGWVFTGFGWNALGVALWENIPMLQIADLTGVAGLSFLICAVNLNLVQTLVRLRKEIGTGAMRPHYDFALTLAAVALVFSYGIRQLFAPKPPAESLRVAAVQANIPQDQKWDPEFDRMILDTYRKHSEFAIAADPDLLVWPEAAMPRAVFSDQAVWRMVADLAESWSGDFLLGTVHFDTEGDFNSVVLLSGGMQSPQFYHKMHLVPFGEYIPFRNSFPVFAWIVGDLVPSDFDAGKDFAVLESRRLPVRIAPLVCFEDTIGRLARHFVDRGAQLFVTVTNDGWFRESSGSIQHLAQSVFRCAENKIPMLRAANTGVTCWIDRHGRVVERLSDPTGSTFLEGVMIGDFPVPVASAGTFYTRHGEVFSLACLLLCCVATLRVFLLAQTSQPKKQEKKP